MKFPIHATIAAVLAAAMPALAANPAEWILLSDNPSGRLLLNPAGRKTPEGAHLVEYRIDFKAPQKNDAGKTYQSATMSVRLSCVAKTMALTDVASHAAPGGKGAEVTREKFAAPVPQPVAGGSSELIWKTVCEPPKPGAAAPAAAAPAPAPVKK
jgi:hypothetical protein